MASGHHDSHVSGYAQDTWSYYNQSQPPHGMSPMNEYPGFEYGQSPMPMEPTYTMPRPPPYVAAHHPLPPPLVMPQNGVWPSMLASQGNYQPPILPATGNHIHTPVSAAPSHGSDMTPTSAKSTSRRKLTDEERRQMCIEAEQNPTMKQTQIGAKFNVERSTVSKILRQKDKYMKPAPKEDVTSPGKKSKVKLPDVEKTLANWARNQLKKGGPISDEELRKQARMFSAGRSDQQHILSQTWLDRFKFKHIEGKGDPDAPLVETSGDASPVSENGLVSPPMSTGDDRTNLPVKLETRCASLEADIGHQDVFDQPGSMPHGLALDLNGSNDTILSPVTPDLSRADGLAVTLPDEHSALFNFARQRSQTFHHLPEAVDLALSPPGMKTPTLPVRSMINAHSARDTSIDPRQMMKRHKSVPNIHDTEAVSLPVMQPPPLPPRNDMSPPSNPGSPSAQDDNIRALYSIKQLLEQRPDVAEPDDYVMIGKLLEKLKLLRSPCGTPIMSHSINPLEPTKSPRLSKKRTILGIST